MILYSLILEILVVAVLLAAAGFAWRLGRREGLGEEPGWALVQGGILLLLFGSLVDISDHFPSLSRLLILGQTPYQAVAEKVVGFLGGFSLLALGLRRWLPVFAARRRAEEELRRANEKLEEQAKRDSDELALKALDLEREIRERQEAASALQRSEQMLHTVLMNAPVALLATDPVGRITLAQGSALPAVGLEPGEIVGRSAFEALSGEPGLADNLERALDGERTSSTVDVDGRVFQYQHTPWRNADGTPAGSIVVATDVTELERAREELRRAKEEAEAANRAKSRFLANMSHELRTPLNSVIGFANILARNKKGHLEPQELRYLERIQGNGRHLLELIDEILDLSRIESGRITLDFEPLDLRQLITDTVAQLGYGDGRDGVALALELPERAHPLITDPRRLRQVLTNLLGNAFKFTTEGQVTVRLEVDPEKLAPLEIVVADTGIGIPEDRMATIFEAFRQIDSSKARSHGGAGLGLSIARSLCRLMGYGIEAESETGRGSTFRVVLRPAAAIRDAARTPAGDAVPGDLGHRVPAVAEPAAEAEPQGADLGFLCSPEDRGGDLQGKRILVIDDSADARLLMMSALEELGCRPLAAASGDEGLLLARQERPDVITLDLVMPEMNGWEVLADLQREPELAEIPVVVVSVVGEEERATLLGASEVLSKPVDRDRLLASLHRVLLPGGESSAPSEAPN